MDSADSLIPHVTTKSSVRIRAAARIEVSLKPSKCCVNFGSKNLGPDLKQWLNQRCVFQKLLCEHARDWARGKRMGAIPAAPPHATGVGPLSHGFEIF